MISIVGVIEATYWNTLRTQRILQGEDRNNEAPTGMPLSGMEPESHRLMVSDTDLVPGMDTLEARGNIICFV